jgi:hypothetical protein
MELLTLDQRNKLEAAPQVYDHLQQLRPFYLSIARRVLRDEKELEEIDRVDFVALFIKKYDKDVFGLDGKGMSVDEICNLYARAVVGHEDEDDSHAN